MIPILFRKLIIPLILLTILLLSPLYVPVSSKTSLESVNSETADDWPMSRHDLARSGYSASIAPSKMERVRLLWRSQINVSSSPAIVDGRLYACSADTAYCLNATTGSQIWTRQGGGSSPTVSGGRVYVGSYCLDATNGSEIWNSGIYGSSPAVYDDIVFVCSSYGNSVHALNVSTGNVIWNYKTYDIIYGASPAVVDGIIYIG
ncbi:MAG: hypothetical protein QG670_729, partial [Thermoproteota archaeon]|nr:hypothetical protein [Thermoproteota archaeon]